MKLLGDDIQQQFGSLSHPQWWNRLNLRKTTEMLRTSWPRSTIPEPIGRGRVKRYRSPTLRESNNTEQVSWLHVNSVLSGWIFDSCENIQLPKFVGLKIKINKKGRVKNPDHDQIGAQGWVKNHKLKLNNWGYELEEWIKVLNPRELLFLKNGLKIWGVERH